MAWPSGTKAATTHMDQGSDLISNARADIKQTVDNVNDVIDYFGTNGAYDEVGQWNKQQYADLQTLTPGASISWDLNSNQVAVVTLNQNSTLANPTNQQAGATYILIVKQPAGANYTLAYGTSYLFQGSVYPTITPVNGAIDIISFISDGTNMYGVAAQDFG